MSGAHIGDGCSWGAGWGKYLLAARGCLEVASCLGRLARQTCLFFLPPFAQPCLKRWALMKFNLKPIMSLIIIYLDDSINIWVFRMYSMESVLPDE